MLEPPRAPVLSVGNSTGPMGQTEPQGPGKDPDAGVALAGPGPGGRGHVLSVAVRSFSSETDRRPGAGRAGKPSWRPLSYAECPLEAGGPFPDPRGARPRPDLGPSGTERSPDPGHGGPDPACGWNCAPSSQPPETRSAPRGLEDSSAKPISPGRGRGGADTDILKPGTSWSHLPRAKGSPHQQQAPLPSSLPSPFPEYRLHNCLCPQCQGEGGAASVGGSPGSPHGVRSSFINPLEVGPSLRAPPPSLQATHWE